MKNSILVLCLSLVCLVSCKTQEGENIFSYQNGQVFAKEKFIKIGNDLNTQGWLDTCWAMPKYIVSSADICSENEEYDYQVQCINFSPTESSETDYEFIAIKSYNSGNFIFKRIGYGTLTKIKNSFNINANANFLQVPLNEETFALIFTGLQYMEEPNELMIVVVNKNNATLVYDGRAEVLNYSPYPNFSIEFVETLDWIVYEDNSSDFVPCSDCPKHRIWQEGNMLKYTTW